VERCAIVLLVPPLGFITALASFYLQTHEERVERIGVRSNAMHHPLSTPN
jgi:hypothetical protein